MDQWPRITHLKMYVHKVREKHHPANQTAFMMELTALSIRLNMKLTQDSQEDILRFVFEI